MDLNLNVSTFAAAAILIFTLSLSSRFHPAQGVDCYKCQCLKVVLNPNPATTPPPAPVPPGRRRRRRRRQAPETFETDKEICSNGCAIYTTASANEVVRGCKDATYDTHPGSAVADCKDLTLYEGNKAKGQKCTCSTNDCNSEDVKKVPITQSPCGGDCDDDDGVTPLKLSLPLFFATLILLPLPLPLPLISFHLN